MADHLTEMLTKVNHIVSNMILDLNNVYEAYSIQFTIKREYLHTVLMSLIAPTQIVSYKQAIEHPYIFPTIKRVHFGLNQKQKIETKVINLPAHFVNKVKSLFEVKDRENYFKCERKFAELSKNNPGMGLTPDQESILSEWVVSESQKGNHMDLLRIQRKARKLAQSSNFKASSFWINGFVKRNPWVRQSMYNIDGAPVEDESSGSHEH